MERHPQYLDRIDRLKEKVFETYPEIDLEDAKLLTQSFLETPVSYTHLGCVLRMTSAVSSR